MLAKHGYISFPVPPSSFLVRKSCLHLRARASSLQSFSNEDKKYKGPGIKCSNPTHARSGDAKYPMTFQVEWSKEWPCYIKGSTAHHYWCSICQAERLCGHQGRKDIKRHIGSDGRVQKVEAVRSSGKIQNFFNVTSSVDQMTALEAKFRKAEVKVAKQHG